MPGVVCDKAYMEEKFSQGPKAIPHYLEIKLLQQCTFGRATGTIKRLIQQKANVNFANEVGETPLQNAVKSLSPEFVEILVEAKVDVHAKDSKGMTAHDIAVNNIEKWEKYKKDMEERDVRQKEHEERVGRLCEGQPLDPRWGPSIVDPTSEPSMARVYKTKETMDAVMEKAGKKGGSWW